MTQPSYTLISSLPQLEEFIGDQAEHEYFGMDTEGTGLNTRSCKLVGFSLAFTEGTGCYVPVGHKIGQNLPLDRAYGLVDEYMRQGNCPVFYNAKFDLNVLQVATRKPIEIFMDALELTYLENPDRKRKGLKLVAKEDLGFDMDTFESLFTPAEIKAKKFDISTKAPQKCTDYASADADATLRVWNQKRYIVDEFKVATSVDHKLIDIVRKMEHNGGMELNHTYIQEQMEVLEARGAELQRMIFRAVGYEFEINSPKKLGEALFDRLGLPVNARTKSGGYSTSEETLDKLKDSYPVVEWVISYRKCVKARTTYFRKLSALKAMGLRPRFNFNIFAAPTFRFAAPGGDPKVDGATGVNIQAVSNGEARTLEGVDLDLADLGVDYLAEVEDEDIFVDFDEEVGSDATVPEAETIAEENWNQFLSDTPYIINNEEGKPICFRDTCSACPGGCEIKGIDTTRRPQKGLKIIPSVREAFRAPEGYKLVSFDYDRQELVIGANMSGEPRWLRALANGDDLHEMTASAAFGLSLDAFQALPKGEYKRKRGVGKTLNFATFYGATAYTLANKADISQAAADQIYNTFKANHPTLFNWMSKVHIHARKTGYTTTYFGRKRSLKQFYDSSNPKDHAFANRSAVNTAIQGTAAEVTRIAMVKVDQRLKKEGIKPDQVRMVLQIHDELAFVIRDDMLNWAIPVIRDCMQFEVKSWEVQLSVGGKVGQVWGTQKDVIIEPDGFKFAA